MITKMTKYSFVLLSGEKEGFLEQLQELGVVDISRSVKPVDQASHEMMGRASKARKVMETLEALNYSKDADYEAVAKTTVSIEGDPVTFVEESIAKLADLKNCEVHSSVILSGTDEHTLKKLGLRLTCEPSYESKRLYHGY